MGFRFVSCLCDMSHVYLLCVHGEFRVWDVGCSCLSDMSHVCVLCVHDEGRAHTMQDVRRCVSTV